MNRLRLPSLLIATLLWTTASLSGEARTVLVELFTSQGCSSCPRADALLSELERAQPVPGVEIVTLSQHVDYWNDLGWLDPYSSPLFTRRQEAYVPALDVRTVYTPQLVVDGRAELVGSDRRRSLVAIRESATAPSARVRLLSGSPALNPSVVRFRVEVDGSPPLSPGDTVEIVLALRENRLAREVSSGENAGRRLEHDAVVRWMRIIGEAPDRNAFVVEANAPIGSGWKLENLDAVAFLQERASRRVIGVSSPLPLSGSRSPSSP